VSEPKQIIGLLGGTFDPPHMGHLEVAKAALASGQVDIVWLLPCWKHAFGKEPTTFYHRAAMCYHMVKTIPDIYVCTDEAEIKSTYSIEILQFIINRNLDKKFRLIMGTDNYLKMDQWKEKDKVLELAPPIWVDRPGVKEIPEPFILCNSTISSTEIRTCAQNRGILVPSTIHSDVRSYIVRHSLYGIHIHRRPR